MDRTATVYLVVLVLLGAQEVASQEVNRPVEYLAKLEMIWEPERHQKIRDSLCLQSWIIPA